MYIIAITNQRIVEEKKTEMQLLGSVDFLRTITKFFYYTLMWLIKTEIVLNNINALL